MSSFDADEAKRITANYFAEARKTSGNWIEEQIKIIAEKIHEAASLGKEEYEHAVELDMDKERVAKTKFLLHELIKRHFKVGVDDKRRDHKHKLLTVFNISWSAPEALDS